MSAPLDLPIFGKTEINLPAWFAVPYLKQYGYAKDGKTKRYIQAFRLANPMTTSRNLSNRRHEHSVDIRRQAGLEVPEVDNSWDDSSASHDLRKSMTLDKFSAKDQERIKKMEQHEGETYTNYPVLSRGRPEELPKNKEYNRHHKKHNLEQKYGKPFLEKVKETQLGRPPTGALNNGLKNKNGDIGRYGDYEESVVASPVSSRTGSSSSGSKSKSRLSSLASSLRSSIPSDSDSGSDSESDEEESESDEESEAGKNVFRPTRTPPKRKLIIKDTSSSSGSSRSSKSSKPSVSRGKPPLKRKEPNPAKTTKALERAKAMEEKKRAKAEAKEAREKAKAEAKEAREKAKAEKPKTKTTKPTPSEAGEEITKKARGRTPKYATKEEAYQAKLESNKLGKQRKAEALKKAKEDKAEKGEASPPKAKGKKKQNVELVIEE